MRKTLLLLVLLIPVQVTARVVWQTSFQEAMNLAQRENKPILLLHLFGRLDQEFT